MHEIDRKAFGAFISSLRREKGLTQKELAEKLYISDKAVSKWETGASIPDTAMLMPLAELLGVTVTELLMCNRTEPDAKLDAAQVDDVVKTALHMDEKPMRAYQVKTRWPLVFVLCLAACAAIMLVTHLTAGIAPALPACVACAGACAVYFIFFALLRLPAYYDQYPVSIYSDGPLRMNMIGVHFNNTNWPHILHALRIWSCASLAALPALNLVMGLLAPALWSRLNLFINLALCLGGLFGSIYIMGVKYEK